MSGARPVRLVKAAARIVAVTTVRAVVALSVGFLLFVGIGPHVVHYRVLTVLTGSMRPTAAPGDLVVDTPVPLDRLAVGDVITYQAPTPEHQVLSHRIIEIRNPGPHPTIRTKGDANKAPDPWLATLQRGPAWRTRFVVQKAGIFVRLLRRSHVHTATTRAVPVLLALSWLTVIWRRDEPEVVPAT